MVSRGLKCGLSRVISREGFDTVENPGRYQFDKESCLASSGRTW